MLSNRNCHDWLCSYMAEFFEPYYCKYSILEAIAQIFVQRNDSLIYVILPTISLGDSFGSYLRLAFLMEGNCALLVLECSIIPLQHMI